MTLVTDILAPLEQEGTKAVVRKWLKKIGEPVRLNEPVVELETDKVAVEVAAEADGVLAEIVVEAGLEAGPGALLGRLSAIDEARAREAPEPEPVRTPAASSSGPMKAFDPELRLSPSVRRILMESGLDPRGLTGTGRGGRLTRQDVEAEIARRARSPEQPKPAPAIPRPGPLPSLAVGVTSVPHDLMRLRIAEHMSRSVATAPHVTAVFEADFSAVLAHRRAHKAEFERHGVNLTITAYIVAAAAEAMAAAPAVNSRWHDDRLDLFSDANIGIGTALGDKGLIVPVIHKAQSLSLLGIAERLRDVTERARTGKLAQADVQGGTFSISNHGVSGSLVATPIIINQPQSAILGVGKLEKRLVVREVDGADVIQIRPMAYVSLTIDHRAIDGHQTNAWLTRFVQTLERWK